MINSGRSPRRHSRSPCPARLQPGIPGSRRAPPPGSRTAPTSPTRAGPTAPRDGTPRDGTPGYPAPSYGTGGRPTRDPALAEWWQRLLARLVDDVILVIL